MNTTPCNSPGAAPAHRREYAAHDRLRRYHREQTEQTHRAEQRALAAALASLGILGPARSLGPALEEIAAASLAAAGAPGRSTV